MKFQFTKTILFDNNVIKPKAFLGPLQCLGWSSGLDFNNLFESLLCTEKHTHVPLLKIVPQCLLVFSHFF